MYVFYNSIDTPNQLDGALNTSDYPCLIFLLWKIGANLT